MSGLSLVLALTGFLPTPALLAGPAALELHAGPALHLEINLAAPLDPFAPLARELDGGISVGSIKLGVDGRPGTPWVSTFLHQQEVQLAPIDLARIDPATVASSVIVRVQIALD